MLHKEHSLFCLINVTSLPLEYLKKVTFILYIYLHKDTFIYTYRSLVYLVMFTTHFPWLTAIVIFPLLASLAIPLIPTKEGKNIRTFALGVALADLAIAISAFWNNFNLNVKIQVGASAN